MIYRMYEVCSAVEPQIEEDNIAQDYIMDIYPVLEIYSIIDIENPDIKSRIINSMIINSFINDERFLSIDTSEDFLKYLSMTVIHVESDYEFDVHFPSFLKLCENFEYNSSIKYVCKDLITCLINFYLSSDSEKIEERIRIISNLSIMLKDFKEPEQGLIQGLYDGFNKAQNSKLSDLIDKDDLEMIAGAAGQFLADYGHAEIGKDISDAVINASDEIGIEVAKSIYGSIAKNPNGVTELADDLVRRMGVGDIPIGDAMNSLSKQISDNSDKLENFES